MKKLLFAALAAVVVGCQGGAENGTANPTDTGETPNPSQVDETTKTDGGTTSDAGGATFASVQQLLNEKCVGCHGASNPKEDLNLTSYETLMKGGEHGAVVVAGKPDESKIIHAMRGGHGVKRMPPMGDPVAEDKIKIVEDWIAAGAKQ